MLSMSHISKRFGATQALKNVSLNVRAGEVLALIGENGAGKSTLMKVLSGAHAPDSGEMVLHGKPYLPKGPHMARQAGVAMIYQELNLAPDLSVEDNIMLGIERSSWGLLRRNAQQPLVRAALQTLGHRELNPQAIVSRLSVGAQQLVEIARGLVMGAQVLVFDEPTSSLPRQDVDHLFEVIRRLREQGRAIIYISHFLEEVRQIADSYAVLRDGETAGTGRLSDVSDREIVSLMVGRNVEELFPQIPHRVGKPVLEIEGLSGIRLPQHVSLTLHRGEILGISGLVGAGRTEFLRCIFGLDPVRSGAVRVAGVAARPTSRRQIAAGIGFVSEDRKGEGLAQNLSIMDNVVLSRMAPYAKLGWLNRHKMDQSVQSWMETLEVKGRDASQSVDSLSGGNQQKVALARVLHQQAEVLLLDEPTRGIDVGTKARIYRLMGEAAAAGKGVLFVSSYLPELLAVCDRIAVMARGELRAVREAREWSEEEIMSEAIRVEGTI